MIEALSATELAQWLADAEREQPLLLDVREPWEYEYCHIADSTLLPMGEIPQRLTEIDRARPVVVICHHGMRSLQTATYLKANGFTQLLNLQGGVDAWANEVDPTMKKY